MTQSSGRNESDMKLVTIDPAQTRGLKVFMVGFLLTAVGFGIALLDAIDIGWFVIWGGGLIGLVGLVWHFLLMISALSK